MFSCQRQSHPVNSLFCMDPCLIIPTGTYNSIFEFMNGFFTDILSLQFIGVFYLKIVMRAFLGV